MIGPTQPRHDALIAVRDAHFSVGSSDGRHQLSVEMSDDKQSTRLTVSVAPLGHLDRHFENLTDEDTVHVAWSLAAPRLSGQAITDLRNALDAWLERPIDQMAGSVFEHQVLMVDNTDWVAITFQQAGQGWVQSSLSNTTLTVDWRTFGATASFEWSVDITVLEQLRASLDPAPR